LKSTHEKLRYLTSYFETTRQRIQAAKDRLDELEIQIVKDSEKSMFSIDLTFLTFDKDFQQLSQLKSEKLNEKCENWSRKG
jgi:hypothetical protein